MFNCEITPDSLDVVASYKQFQQWASAQFQVGAAVVFTGQARQDDSVEKLFLEHYPGLTESETERLMKEARQRFSLAGVIVQHRVGWIMPGEDIVLVVCASEHRQSAFSAAQYIMDQLKSRVPIWKKELRNGRESWVEQKASDQKALEAWQNPPS